MPSRLHRRSPALTEPVARGFVDFWVTGGPFRGGGQAAVVDAAAGAHPRGAGLPVLRFPVEGPLPGGRACRRRPRRPRLVRRPPVRRRLLQRHHPALRGPGPRSGRLPVRLFVGGGRPHPLPGVPRAGGPVPVGGRRVHPPDVSACRRHRPPRRRSLLVLRAHGPGDVDPVGPGDPPGGGHGRAPHLGCGPGGGVPAHHRPRVHQLGHPSITLAVRRCTRRQKQVRPGGPVHRTGHGVQVVAAVPARRVPGAGAARPADPSCGCSAWRW